MVHSSATRASQLMETRSKSQYGVLQLINGRRSNICSRRNVCQKHFNSNVVVLQSHPDLLIIFYRLQEHLLWCKSLQKSPLNLFNVFFNENEKNYVKIIILSNTENHTAIKIPVQIIPTIPTSPSPMWFCWILQPVTSSRHRSGLQSSVKQSG